MCVGVYGGGGGVADVVGVIFHAITFFAGFV